MENGLARADRHDEVGLDERGMDAMDVTGDLEGPEVLRLAVVNGDLAAECAGPVRPQEQLELAAAGATAEAAGDEDGVPLARDAVQLELVEDGGEDVPARVLLDGGQREPRRLHDDRRPTAARRDGLEGRPRQRVAERLGDRGADVHEGVERRRRRDEHRVVGKGDHRKPGAGVEGDAEHAGHLHGRIGRDASDAQAMPRNRPVERRDGIRGAERWSRARP